MVKEGETTTAASPFWRDLFSLGFYKRSQGRIARQVTFGALVLAAVLGAWSLSAVLQDNQVSTSVRYAIVTVIGVLGIWLSFRLVNMPRFADFLIAVEAEMNKVSWPTKPELVRSVIVVIVTIVGLAVVLFLFDMFWQFVLGPAGLRVLG
jgi:preprotein translocase subunit SecE